MKKNINVEDTTKDNDIENVANATAPENDAAKGSVTDDGASFISEEEVNNTVSDEVGAPVITPKKKKSLGDFFKSLSPKQVAREVSGFGFKFQAKTAALCFLIFAAVICLFAMIINLTPVLTIMMVVISSCFLPKLIVNAYRKKFNTQKFADLSQYIEQMLYAFKHSYKLYKSLEDVMPMFKTSVLYEDLKVLQEDILSYGNAKALRNFEKKYPYDKISQMHKIILDSEVIGGEVDTTIDILIDDNSAWKERAEGFARDRKSWKVSILAAVIISFGLCIFMERILHLADIDISSNMIVQMSTAIAFILEIAIYTIGDTRLSKSLLDNLSLLDDETVKKYYEDVVNYNPKVKWKRSLVFAASPFLAGIACIFILNETTIGVICILFAVFAAVAHSLKHKSQYKAIKNEIVIQFPKWLMSMALLTQTNSVFVSLYKSIYTAPTVLKPELVKLNNALTENPTSVEPYFDFMKEFDMKEITASMKMFYAISSGAGSDTQKQIADIIKRTNKMVDKSERTANDNFIARLNVLFYSPQLIGGFKLMIDMVIFFISFASSKGF